MSAMRAAKARRRAEKMAAGLSEREPKLIRWYPFEYGVRDNRTGETCFRDLVSVRQAAKALGLILKHLQPTDGFSLK